MKQSIQEQIVSQFWSRSFRAHLQQTNYEFNDLELMAVTWHSVAEYQERLRLLRLIAAHIPAASDHARLCADYMETSLSRFKQRNPGEVYELCITDQDSHDELYLCDTYETALQIIDKFWARYDFSHETPTTEYSIYKRKVLCADSVFDEDKLGHCRFGPGKVLLEADLYDLNCEYYPCGNDCTECEKTLVNGSFVLYPPFLPNLSLVKYRKFGNIIEYGITFEPNRDEESDAVYILPLGGYMEPGWWDHDHIYPWNVDTVLEDELNDHQKEQAASLLRFLEDWMAKNAL